MRKLLTCLLIAGLGGCAGSAERLRGSERYQALGHDPGWLLTVKGGRLAFASSTPKLWLEMPQPLVEPTNDGRRYLAGQLRVDVYRQPCNDARSGVAFAETVAIVVGETTYRGCGGKRVPILDR
jgi:heat shock protein HslJ